MRYRIEIRGLSPLIQHDGQAGLDTRSPAKLEIAEITRKTGSNRTAADDERLAALETIISIYWNDEGLPTIPEAALRAAIEGAARKLRQGPQVREGLVVEAVEKFEYPAEMGSTREQLSKSARFTVPVVVQRNRILRTRALFPDWSCVFVVDADDELVDRQQLEAWLDIAGRRIGIGDWRPQRSGHYGRFETASIDPIE